MEGGGDPKKITNQKVCETLNLDEGELVVLTKPASNK